MTPAIQTSPSGPTPIGVDRGIPPARAGGFYEVCRTRFPDSQERPDYGCDPDDRASGGISRPCGSAAPIASSASIRSRIAAPR
jgi:hypothetical protein